MERKTLEERSDELLERVLREAEELIGKSKADLTNSQLGVSEYLDRLDKISRIALAVKYALRPPFTLDGCCSFDGNSKEEST